MLASLGEVGALGLVAGAVDGDEAADILFADAVNECFEVAAGEVVVAFKSNVTTNALERREGHDVF